MYTSLILIVDDTATGRDILEALLQSPAYQLAFAGNGAEALVQAEALTPDLILLDVMMPGMDGFEVCRRLRANPRLAEIPIILVTALDDRASRLRGIEAGADDFVTKPFDHAELRARVRTITRLNRYRRLVDERTRFEWVLEQADEGYLLLGKADEIVYANKSACRLLHLPASVTFPTQESFATIVQQTYRCEPAQGWNILFRQPMTPIEGALHLIRPESPNAQAMWLEVTVLSQMGDQHMQRLLHLRDVTAQMSTQRDIWTFHSMIMHKLNTPLHAITGGLQLLTPDTIHSLQPKELGEVAKLVLSGVERLNSTINDILQYVRMPIGAQSQEGFSLNDLERLVQQISTGLNLKKVMIINRCKQHRQLNLSQRATECILWEVLENSQKFHPQQSPHVEIEVSDFATNAIRLQIIDDGRNVTPEQLEKVFLPYFQAEKFFTGEVPGVGLGLTMVARLLWEAGGVCRFRNREGAVGVIVDLVIPLA